MLTPNDSMFIKGIDGKDIFVYIWNKAENPKGIVQIFHGMGEHAERYNDFAEFLNKKGFIVYANDHLGHGKTAGAVKNLGYIGSDGFNAIVEDEYIITKHIKSKYSRLPIIILGHSFGSFVAQEYLSRYSTQIDGMILSGSALQKGLPIHVGRLITSFQYHLRNEKSADKLTHTLSFASYTAKFIDSHSKCRWLSSDKGEVEKYERDPYCGFIFSVNFYYHLLKGLKGLYKKDKLSQIRKDIPILILSGAMDPVGNYGKSVNRLYHLYTHLSLKDISLKLFAGGRHEMLNEVNKLEVYTYLLNWICQKI